MPSYFFHLAFELYPKSADTEDDRTAEPGDPFLPLPDTNIFTSQLPDSSWITSSKNETHKPLGNIPSIPHQQSTRATENFHQPDPAAPADIQHSPPPRESHQARSSSPGVYATRDWRFGLVSIQSIDMEVRDTEGASGLRGKSVSRVANSGGSATKGRYVPGNLKNTEVGWGVVHLYRDAEETPGLYDNTVLKRGKTSKAEGSNAFNEEDCTTLCILAVPSYMTPSDFLGFVGEQTREDVSHFRLVRTGRTNKYMVLMKFRKAKAARAWRKEWNGKLFNSMEPENCHVVFVKSIEFRTGDTSHGPSSFPNMTNDPFTPAARPAPTAPLPTKTSSLTTKPIPPPTPSLVELPTCPVCLERMDETTGLLTILCQHVFHCACLEKWRGSGCPVCRYTQSDPRGYTSNESLPENECSVCGSNSNLWICLICGNVGCGRYDSAHAFAHYEATGHSFAMDVVTQHVWDYVGDEYVHRLIQSKDGKLVDLPAAGSTMTGIVGDTVPREKLDNMGMEYVALLTSQLENQRLYFEQQVERAVDKAAKAGKAAEEATNIANKLSLQFKELQANHTEAKASITILERDLQRSQRRAEKSDALARKLGKDWREEKTMNEALSQKITFMENKVKEAEKRSQEMEAEKKDLEEQNRDLTFFISTSEKLREEGVGEDVIEGKIEVPVVPEESKGGKKKKGKSRR